MTPVLRFHFRVVASIAFFAAAAGLPRPAPALEARIDAERRLVVDGQPRFPVGIYHIDPGLDPAYVQGTGFDCVINHQDDADVVLRFLDVCAARRLLYIPQPDPRPEWWTSKDPARADKANKLIRHPALLGWYLTDEPDLQGIPPAQLQARHAAMKARDPAHLTFTVLADPSRYADYAETTDVFMVDPYPVCSVVGVENPSHPLASITAVGDCVRWARRAVRDRKPVWYVGQAFDWRVDLKQPLGDGPRPTPVEIRNMTYQALVAGAKGVLYFRYMGKDYYDKYPALWSPLPALTRELAALAPALLAPGDPRTLSVDAPEIQWMEKSHEGRTHLILVNASPRRVRARVALSGPEAATVLFEDRSLQVHAWGFEDAFEPLAVHVYRLPGKIAPSPCRFALECPPALTLGQDATVRVSRDALARGLAADDLAFSSSVPLAFARSGPGAYRVTVPPDAPCGPVTIRAEGVFRAAGAQVPMGAWAESRIAPPSLDVPRPPRQLALDDAPAAWGARAPLSLADGSRIHVQWDEKALYLLAEVPDAVWKQDFSGSDLWKGDSLQLAFDAVGDGVPNLGRGANHHEFLLALTARGPEVWRSQAPNNGTALGAVASARLAVDRGQGVLTYRAVLPWGELRPFVPRPGARVGAAILVNQDEGGGRRAIPWGGGIDGEKDPRRFGEWVFVK